MFQAYANLIECLTGTFWLATGMLGQSLQTGIVLAKMGHMVPSRSPVNTTRSLRLLRSVKSPRSLRIKSS